MLSNHPYRQFRRKLLMVVLLLTALMFALPHITGQSVYADGDGQAKTEHESTSDIGHDESGSRESHGEGEEHDGEHGGMEPLFFIILALIIGAATKHFLRKSPLPYTVTLLLLGLLIGLVNRLWMDYQYVVEKELLDTFWGAALYFVFDPISNSIKWAGHIDPHAILYVFLPTLIYEAAFAMDVHTFKKSVTNAFLLAVPGILLAMFLTAAFMIGINRTGLGLSAWNWQIALMFGAIVSATDPVAVVALLKELGASKKLGTLIEGESLLNDGTAIVIFMVFFLAITGESTTLPPVLEFFRVSLGGILLGGIVGFLVIGWVRHVFNNAMVEISVMVAAAYLTFFLAEHYFHVSGVLGLVTIGLLMASIGRTRISPEVEHFLHEFWELAAFIANTLIFVIVGVVIAQRIEFTAVDFVILLLLYVGIHVVRAILVVSFYPLMKRFGYGLSKPDAKVLWWGALRGAIGLALALVVAGVDDKYIEPEIKNQVLFLTAGIVTLTLLINATTIKWLVNRLGLTKVPAAKALMMHNANVYLFQSTENSIERIKTDRFMSRANWDAVKEYLPDDPGDMVAGSDEKIETIAEIRRRILEKEKSSYWHQFKDGLLGSTAVRQLSEGLNEVLDAGGMISLAARKDLEEMWKTPKFLDRMQTFPLVGKIAQRLFFDRLTVSYDLARAFVVAQEEVLKLVESMYRHIGDEDLEDMEKNLAIIEEEINENKIQGQTFLRNLRKSYPEIYNAIATRQAIRTMLNYERRTVERLQKNGRIDSTEAHKMTDRIEERMKLLIDSPPRVKLPDAEDLLKEVNWLKGVDQKTYNEVVSLFQSRVYSVDDTLIEQGDSSDGLYVIARGTVKVMVGDHIVSILGAGHLVGEISLLNGIPRTASVVAESPVTVLRIKYLKIKRLLEENQVLRDNLWQIAARRYAANILLEESRFAGWREKKLKGWLKKGELIVFEREDKIINLRGRIVILLNGVLYKTDKERTMIIEHGIIEAEEVYMSPSARLFICAELVK